MMAPLWRTPLETVWNADRFDQAEWLSAVDSIPQLSNADQQAARDLCGHPVQDGFFGLFKANPRLVDEPASSLQPLAGLMKRGTETPEWARLRETTMGDSIAAGIGAQALVEEVLKALPEEVKQQAQQQAREQQKAEEAQSQAEALTTLAQMLSERAMGGNETAANAAQQAEDVQRKALQAQTQAAQAQARADAARAAFQASLNSRLAQVTAALNHAAETAREQAEDATNVVRSFSLAAGGDPVRVDPATAQAATEMLKVNPNLKHLADLLGWARKMVRGEWRKSAHGKSEMTGYSVQPLQPEHMAGFEYAALLSGDDTLHLDWLRRAVDGGIRHRRYTGQEKQGRGPLVLVRDESGSMEGDPHATAVALEWALLEICRRDRRDFHSIPFSGSGQFHVWHDPRPGLPDPQGLLEHLAHFYNGGTEPYLPLLKAVELIAGGDLRADILIITDGAFGEPPEDFLRHVAEVKQQHPLRLVAVLVGSDEEQAQAFADRVIAVGDLFEDRERLRDAVAGVI
jgi:uncharacterized protein with von Willebrand factor type A (vWA) domain